MSKYLARLNAIIREKHLPTQVPKVPEGAFGTFGSGVDRRVCRSDAAEPTHFGTFGTGDNRRVSRIEGPLDPDDVELEERKAMAMDSLPEPYLDAWARLQCQKPMRVSDDDWRQAVDDAGRFLEQWGSPAVEFQWAPADLFDVPRDGRPGGLVWFLNGETVRSLGPEHAVTTSDQVWRRARPMAAAR